MIIKYKDFEIEDPNQMMIWSYIDHIDALTVYLKENETIIHIRRCGEEKEILNLSLNTSIKLFTDDGKEIEQYMTMQG